MRKRDLAKTGRGYAGDLKVGQFQLMIDSWDLHLRAEKKSAKRRSELPPEERRQRAEHAKRAYMLQLAKRSAVARKARSLLKKVV